VVVVELVLQMEAVILLVLLQEVQAAVEDITLVQEHPVIPRQLLLVKVITVVLVVVLEDISVVAAEAQVQ
jgi:hypothetical protein